ncbi:MAG: MarR family transcriptional regulator [Paracoccaceae bacterium]
MNVVEPVEYRLEDQIGFKLRLAYQKHAEIFVSMQPEVTPTQFAAMIKLKECGLLSQNHLGRLIAMDAATTKGVIDRLRKKGLVQTEPSTTDLRRLDVSLTAEGLAFIAAAVPVAHRISAATTLNLSKADAAKLLALLDRL